MKPMMAALVGTALTITFMIPGQVIGQDAAQPVLEADVPCHEPALPDTFFARPEGVVLQVGVIDREHQPIGDLTREDFAVREDAQPQRINYFSSDSEPVSIGLVIDATRHAGAVQADAITAGLASARASRTADEFFAVAFNDRVRDVMPADFPFTQEPEDLGHRLLKIGTGGRRALYDAMAQGLNYGARSEREQRVLIVISNGHDTASSMTFAQLAERVVASPTVIYAIGLFGSSDPDAAVALKRLAELSGGDAEFASDPGDLRSMIDRTVRQIGTTYAIGYMPSDPDDGARVREVTIVLTSGQGDKRLRYRHAYVGGSR